MEKPDHTPTGIGSGAGSVSGPENQTLLSVVVEDKDKKFACSQAGCEKNFTRAEHLHRHALYHTNGDHTCPRCSAAFKRRDLLDRHMNRHRQKDLEAGGEGCGVLDTRKRAWKAPDGSVAERRPHPLERAPARGRRGAFGKSSRSEEVRNKSHPVSVESQTNPQQAPLQLPTSPISERETDDSIFQVTGCGNRLDSIAVAFDPLVNDQPQNQLKHHQNHNQQQQQQQHLEPGPSPPQFDLLLNSLLPSSYASEDPWQLWNEQPFQPDTASSFNMPYTTAIDYNWLFNVPQPLTSGQPDQYNVFEPVSYANVMTPRSSSTSTSTSIQPGSLESLSSVNSSDSHDGRRFDSEHDYEQSKFESPNINMHYRQTTNQQLRPVSPNSVNSNSTSNSHTGNNITSNNVNNMRVGPAQVYFTGDVASRESSIRHADITPSTKFERPLSRLDITAHLPIIDGVTHDRLLTVIRNAKPCLPDCSLSSLQEYPLLSQTAMQSYLDYYFTRFNVAYPIVHTAQFNLSTAEPLILLSIILLWATYVTKDAH